MSVFKAYNSAASGILIGPLSLANHARVCVAVVSEALTPREHRAAVLAESGKLREEDRVWQPAVDASYVYLSNAKEINANGTDILCECVINASDEICIEYTIVAHIEYTLGIPVCGT